VNDERMTRLEEIARKFALPAESPDLPTYACPDCQDTGLISVPCRIKGCIAYGSDVALHDRQHKLVRCCHSCEQGIASEAGIWFRFLWERDRTGKPKLRVDRVPKYREAINRLGPASVKVELALARITDRNKAEQMEAEDRP
jgi:hypothetical protein